MKMDKICLVVAGLFVVGIDAGSISAIQSREDLEVQERKLVHLESFFRQTVPQSRKPGSIVLTMSSECQLPDLLVDQVIVEIDWPRRFEPVPLLYPNLAGECCPKIFLYKKQPVLLLDQEGFVRVSKKLPPDTGVVSLQAWDLLPEKSVPASQPADCLPEDDHALAERDYVAVQEEEKQSIEEELPPNEVEKNGVLPRGEAEFVDSETPVIEAPEETEEPELQEGLNDVPEIVCEKHSGVVEKEGPVRTELTEQEFGNLVYWVIENYLDGDTPARQEVLVQDLPADFFHGQRVDDSVLRKVIDKTLRKCATTSDTDLREIIREMAA